MNMKNEIDYWLKSAEHDLKTAEVLLKNRRYDWCLFVGHLIIEKTLKAFYVRDNKQMPPKTHKLEIIAEKTQLKLSHDQINFLKEINNFNIEARYPDDKFTFYKLCTKKFTKDYFAKIKGFHKWLLKETKL